ncbi:hypothetical protein F2P79_008598 [Pimephales promelas]|nr:hypothetical protein F2P79_008598 [Pimephales promelas]
MGWSEGCLPPPSKSILSLLLRTMTQSKVPDRSEETDSSPPSSRSLLGPLSGFNCLAECFPCKALSSSSTPDVGAGVYCLHLALALVRDRLRIEASRSLFPLTRRSVLTGTTRRKSANCTTYCRHYGDRRS